MAKEIRVLNATARTETGSGPARRLRADGRVPVVLYGMGNKVRSLMLERGEMERAVNHGDRLVNLSIEGKETSVMVKEIQYEPVSRHVSHVDFLEIDNTKVLSLAIPIRLRGIANGVKEGGVLDIVMHEVEVETVPTNVPEEIRLEVKALNIGDTVRASDLILPEGLKLISNPDSVVVALKAPREEEDTEAVVTETEGTAEPEVLTARADDEADPAAAGAAAPAPADSK
jgi:large subunit ribosomal protein L25